VEQFYYVFNTSTSRQMVSDEDRVRVINDPGVRQLALEALWELLPDHDETHEVPLSVNVDGFHLCSCIAYAYTYPSMVRLNRRIPYVFIYNDDLCYNLAVAFEELATGAVHYDDCIEAFYDFVETFYANFRPLLFA